MKRTRLILALAAIAPLLFAGCGGGGSTSTASSSAAPVSSTASPAPTPSVVAPALDIAKTVGGSDVSTTYALTEDNDANNLLGRSNGYSSAAVGVIASLDASQCDAAKPGVDCGFTIEVWPNDAAAIQRGQHIQSMKTGGALGTEYDYAKGGVLLRVSGEVKPSQATQLNGRFGGQQVSKG
ncbi:Putative uncharacterized protein [Propionibacterium freudenreichii]|nr:Putative uncharacterized protein [Propionibacterium freudenreichii]CEI29163.1 Protein of unknown function [Propionibacterium freudenreichii]SBT29206.1 Hypothetical protein PFR_JS14_1047 [Propionibacterium freudenreichii]